MAFTRVTAWVAVMQLHPGKCSPGYSQGAFIADRYLYRQRTGTTIAHRNTQTDRIHIHLPHTQEHHSHHSIACAYPPTLRLLDCQRHLYQDPRPYYSFQLFSLALDAHQRRNFPDPAVSLLQCICWLIQQLFLLERSVLAP